MNVITKYLMIDFIKDFILLEISNYHSIHRMASANIASGILLDSMAFSDPVPATVIRSFADREVTKSTYITERTGSVLTPENAIFKKHLLSWVENNRDKLLHGDIDGYAFQTPQWLHRH